jgi:putative aldouronate transport system substrate-binding protein
MSAHPPHPSRRAVLTTGLGIAALAGISACSSDSDDDGSNSEGGSGGGSAALPAYIPYEGVEADLPVQDGRTSSGFFAYPASPATISTGTPGDGEPITAMGPTSFALPPAMDQNAFWQEKNERLGSELHITLTPGGEYDAKFATTVAGRALPDFFHVGSTQSLPQFMASEAADLTEFLSGDAIAAYPGLANIPTASWEDCIFDGRIRAIPIQRGLVNLPTLFARQDLLEAAGITEPPQTFEELHDLSKEVTGGNTWGWGSLPLAYARSTVDVPSYWTIVDGTFTSTLGDERHEQALEAVRALQDAGVVNPDAASSPMSTKKDWFGAGRSIFHEDSFIAWFSLYVQHGSVPGLNIQALPVIGFDGGTGTQFVPNPNYGITAISAGSADRAETLLRVADYLAAPFGTEEYLFCKYGIEGVNYELEGSDPVPTDAANEVNIGSLYIADAARVIYAPNREAVVQAAWDQQNRVTEKSLQDPTLGLYSETASRKLASLEGALADAELDIMLGRRPVSDWSAAVEEFNAGGGADILAEYQAAYDERQG